MPDGVTVQGPDGKTYQFPAGTDKQAAISYFKKKGIGASPESQRPDAVKQAQEAVSSGIKPLIPGTATQDPTDGKMAAAQAGKDTKYNEYMKQSGRLASETVGGMAGGALVGPLLKGAGAAGGGGFTGWLLKALARNSAIGGGTGVGALASGAKPKDALETAAGTAMIGTTLEGAGTVGSKAVKALTAKADPLARINKILGVGAEDIRVGKAPEAMDEFVTNPARGVQKAGIDEKVLAKMNPIERNSAIVKAKDAAGKQLEASFSAATQQGKTVSLRQTVDDIFKQIPDKNLQAQTRQRLSQIVNKALGKPNVFEEVPYMKMIADLDKLTPNQAWAIRRGLDDFANFASEGTVKTFKDVATELRRAISKETRKIVPESAPFDKQYSDLAAASNATQRSVNKFARDAPKSLLRKWAKRAAIAGGAGAAGGLGYEAGKHFTLP